MMGGLVCTPAQIASMRIDGLCKEGKKRGRRLLDGGKTAEQAGNSVWPDGDAGLKAVSDGGVLSTNSRLLLLRSAESWDDILARIFGRYRLRIILRRYGKRMCRKLRQHGWHDSDFLLDYH